MINLSHVKKTLSKSVTYRVFAGKVQSSIAPLVFHSCVLGVAIMELTVRLNYYIQYHTCKYLFILS